MPTLFSVNEVKSFTFTVVNGDGLSMNLPVGHLYIREVKSALSRHGLLDTAPDYGFQLLDKEGRIVAEVAPGFWPFLKKVIEIAASLQSPACEEDCCTTIGDLTILSGEYNDE